MSTPESILEDGQSGRVQIAAAMSLAIHLAAGLALVASPGLFDGQSSPGQPPSEPFEEIRIRPGIEASRQVTINWLGFADPTPHEAARSEVEQAFLSPHVGSSAPIRAPTEKVPDPAPSVEIAEIAPRAEVSEAVVGEFAETTPAEASPDSIPALASEPLRATPLPVLAVEAATDDPRRELLPPRETPRWPTSPRPGAPLKAGSRAAAGAEANLSQKESDPTALQEPVQWTPGRPPAVEGLDITTVVPKWTVATRLSALPRNPVVRIDFAKDGSVRKAEFLRGRSTGEADVDGPLLDAIYRWRANGKALDDLPETSDAAVSFNMEILLIRSRGTIRRPGGDR